MTPLPARRLAGFVRLLVTAGIAHPDGKGGFRARTRGYTASVGADEARRLVSCGVVAKTGVDIKPTPETRNWLRRRMSEADGFAEQHRRIRTLSDGTRVNDAESPLRRLAIPYGKTGQAFLQPHHVEAGERVRRLVERAGLVPRTTMNYSAEQTVGPASTGAPPALELTDMALDARRRLAWIRSRLPPDCLTVVIDVCGLLKGLQQVESEHGWPRRSAKLVLRIGLDQVAAEFGLAPEAQGRPAAPLRLWRDTPGRPPMFSKG